MKLEIFVDELGKNVTNSHWEWGPISAIGWKTPDFLFSSEPDGV
jgi:hypothetical protein